MLNQDYRDMLSCLRDEAVEFLLVGAYALAAHGYVRATGDIDLWIRNTAENAQRVLQALQKFGAPLFGARAEDFTVPDLILQLGVAPCRIDLITGVDGLTFDEAWTNRVMVQVEGIELAVLSKADLLKNKLAAGRDKDQGDIAWLRKNQERGA
jgi:hypothetical protein